MNILAVNRVLLGKSYTEVEQLCCRLKILAKDIEMISENMASIEKERESLAGEKAEALVQAKETIDKLEQQLLGLSRSHRTLSMKYSECERILGSPLYYVINSVMSVFSSSVKSNDELKLERDALQRKLDFNEKDQEKLSGEKEQCLSLQTELNAPLESMEFAVRSLNTERNNAELELEHCHSDIDHLIMETTRETSASVLACKNEMLGADQVENQVEKMLELKRSIVEHDCLLSRLDIPTCEALWEEKLPQLVEQGFDQTLYAGAGTVHMTGEGHAHKKVRRGDKTTWKKIKVGFSGPVVINPKFKAPTWFQDRSCDDIALGAREWYFRGVESKRNELFKEPLGKLEQRIQALTQGLRASLQIPCREFSH